MIQKKIFTTILFLIIASLLAFSQDSQEPDALYHQITKEYTIHPDGSYDLHYSKTLELKSHFAFNQLFGETFVVYNPEYQDLVINQAYTIMADGTKNPSPENAFNEVLPRKASNFPDYNNLKEMVITHTGLELGATIHLDYTLKTSGEMYGGFSLFEELRKQVPVEKLSVIVHAPEGYELEYQTVNLRTGPEISENGDGSTYTWSFKALQPYPREGNICSSKKQSLAVIGPEGLSSQVDPAAFSWELPAEAAKKVENITKDAGGDAEKVSAVFHFLRATIDASPLPQKFIGNNMRTLKEVWNTNVGTTLERNVMLAAMLREAGIYAEPVMAVEAGALPLLHSNKQLMVKTEMKQTDPLLISADHPKPVNKYYSLPGKELIPLAEEKTDRRLKSGKEKNSFELETELFLNPDSLYGEGSLTLMHALNPYLALVEEQDNIRQLLKGIAVSDGSVTSLSPEVLKGSLRFGASVMPLADHTPGLKVFELPVIKGGVADWDFVLWSDRVTPLQIPYPVNGSMKFTIHLEDLTCLNSSYEQSYAAGFGQVTVKVVVDKDKVVIKKDIALEKTCYNPMEYNELRDILNLYTSKEGNRLIFKRKE
jgi:hypothetical protein